MDGSIDDDKRDKGSGDKTDDWIIGNGRIRVLKFSCNSVSMKSTLPAEKLHMTYKTIQAETKLLNALLVAHGFHEVCGSKFYCT